MAGLDHLVSWVGAFGSGVTKDSSEFYFVGLRRSLDWYYPTST